MKKSSWIISWLTIALSCFSLITHASPLEDAAPVTGFARVFMTSNPIPDATITVLETGLKVKTDAKGHFGPIYHPTGRPITLVFEKWGYQTTQSATIIVPKEGLTTPFTNITFQIPEVPTYYLLAKIIGATMDDNFCHVTATVTAYHKNMDNLPHGEAGVKVRLIPDVDAQPFYFDIFKDGPLKDYTNPFTHGLQQTTEDGGIAYFNLPPRDEPYRLIAEKEGKSFTEAEFICRKGMFINISPPRGPAAQN